LSNLATLLVEQYGFAAGTNSCFSRLLHGGISYLTQGRIGVAVEASSEKRMVGKIAAHLAQPLTFVFPARKVQVVCFAEVRSKSYVLEPSK